jgi:hypothetical protein
MTPVCKVHRFYPIEKHRAPDRVPAERHKSGLQSRFLKHLPVLLFACFPILAGCWGSPSSNVAGTYDIKVITVDPQNSATVYVGTTGGGILKSTDGGGSWRPVNTGLFDLKITALSVDWFTPSWVYAGTEDGGFFFSADYGENWGPSNPSISSIRAIVIDRNQCQTPPCKNIYVGSQETGVWKSTDGGLTFKQMNESLSNTTVTALAIYPTLIPDPTTRLYAATEGGGLFRRKFDETVWTDPTLTGNPGLKQQTQEEAVSMIVNPLDPLASELYVGTSGGEAAVGGSGIYKSIDSGNNFTLSYNPINKYTVFSVAPAIGPSLSDLTLYAGADGIIKSTDRGSVWCILPSCNDIPEILNPGLTAFAVATVKQTDIDGNISFLVDNTNPTFYAGLFNRKLIKTTDGGQTWTTLKFQ